MKYLGLLTVILWTLSGEAQLKSVTLEFNENVDHNYLDFSSSEMGPKKYPYNKLYQIKNAYYEKNQKKCLKLISQHRSAFKGVTGWILNQQFLCASELDFSIRKHRALLQNLFSSMSSKSYLFSQRTSGRTLLENYIKVGLLILEHSVKDNRPQGWVVFNQLEKHSGSMSDTQKSTLYQLTGEMAFVEQNIELAKSLFLRSVKYQSSSELELRLRALDPTRFDSQVLKKSTSPEVELLSSASEDERKIILQVQQAIESNDLLSVVADGLLIMKQFPASYYAQWSKEKIKKIFFSLLPKTDAKYTRIKFKIRDLIKDMDGDTLLKWSRKAFSRNHFTESFWLADLAAEKLKGQKKSAKALRVAAASLHFIGKYEEAKKYYIRLQKISTGTPDSVEAMFKLGLISFRQKLYSEAGSYFERILVTPNNENYEISSMYWLWRSRQNMNTSTAHDMAQRLYEKYPLTYYGIRAYGETHGNKLMWQTKDPVTFKVNYQLTQSESLSLERYRLFVESGWYKEASLEAEALPEPQTKYEKLIMAKIWAGSQRIRKSIELTSSAFNEDLGLVGWNTVKNVFPQAYKDFVKSGSEKYNVDPNLVFALIRQESSFEVRAISSSNAVGLMQMISMTAKELAQDLKIKNFSFPETLFDPNTNIRMGSAYIRKMIRANEGYVPLALASYNVGIGNMGRWMRSRKDLVNLRLTQSSDPHDEIWFDELPWSETRHYVKLVMRNYLYYKLLDQGQVELADPLWK